MHSQTLIQGLVSLATLISLASAHGVIIGAKGDLGGSGTALGVDASTPRTGTKRNPFQQDTTRFKGQQLAKTDPAEVTGCGATILAGSLNIASAMADVIDVNGGLPQVSAGGIITMTVHQINGDGAGPYACMIDMTGTGASFQALTVTTNLPGRKGNNRATSLTDQALVAQLPANMACTGTSGNITGICMVRCQNPAQAGPFGGCVPIQQGSVNFTETATTSVAAPSSVSVVETASASATETSVSVDAASTTAVKITSASNAETILVSTVSTTSTSGFVTSTSSASIVATASTMVVAATSTLASGANSHMKRHVRVFRS